MMRFARAAVFVMLGIVAATPRAEAQAQPPSLSSDQKALIASRLQWQAGTITLRNGLAKINLPAGYRFLAGPDAEKVLHDLWDNPPAAEPLGMIFPAGLGPLDHGGWGVLVEYEEGGHVNDDDASRINYDDLLRQMQQEVRAANPQREQQGYPAMELVGWAQPPHYDGTTHKLYWAKELREQGSPVSGLNYNIRVLGRKGVLVLNAVADMRELDEVADRMPQIMAMVDFQPGSAYADFDPRVDKVAKYGIAALVAGTAVGVAAKAGLLKFLFPALLALKKVIIFVVIAAVAVLKKVVSAIRGRSSVARPFDPPGQASAPGTPVLQPPPGPNREPLRPPDPPQGGLPPTRSF